MTVGDEAIHQMGPDKTRSTGHESAQRFPFLSVSAASTFSVLVFSADDRRYGA